MRAQLARVLRGDRLGEVEAGEAMATIMDGEATPAQIGALLGALAARGETEDEVVGFARVMRARAIRLRSHGAVDTCGTGGDGAGTFNISTVASFVVAACGVRVVKHGNRSAGGSCGSADVLEALGLRLDPGPETVQRSLDEAGWAFLFAPAFHASTRHAAGPRKELGVRTAFNLLGPLTNPAFPEAQIVGVPKPELVGFVSRCLRRLGLKRAWVVHGAGLDEIGLSGRTQVVAFDEAGERSFSIDPEEAGLAPAAVEKICRTPFSSKPSSEKYQLPRLGALTVSERVRSEPAMFVVSVQLYSPSSSLRHSPATTFAVAEAGDGQLIWIFAPTFDEQVASAASDWPWVRLPQAVAEPENERLPRSFAPK